MRIIKETLVVRPEDARPAGKPDRCFYCGNEIGQMHNTGCVIMSKKVKVRFTIEYDIEVPIDWKKDLIEFSRNEGSWCVDNMVAELEQLAKKAEEEDGCLCHPKYNAHFEYIEDEA